MPRQNKYIVTSDDNPGFILMDREEIQKHVCTEIDSELDKLGLHFHRIENDQKVSYRLTLVVKMEKVDDTTSATDRNETEESEG